MKNIEDLEARVGERVREFRLARGWTQVELGQRLRAYGVEMTQTTVAKLEGGGRPIRLNEVGILADLFGVSFGELVEVVGMVLNQDEFVARLRRQREIEGELIRIRDQLEEAEERHEKAGNLVKKLTDRASALRAELAALVAGGGSRG